MHPDIRALAEAHHLPPEVARDFDQLFTRLSSADGGTFALDHSGPGPAVDAPPRAGGGPPAAVTDRYEALGPLGVGGMGEVSRVRDRALGRTCAFKVLRAASAGRTALVGRFEEEARIAAQLQHPNIPPLYDAGRLPDGRPWFTMKEVQGHTLGAAIEEAHAQGLGDASLRRLCDVLGAVCDAVAYAHGRGVVHRDLKPDNVMLGAHGEVFVLDWGLAKVVGGPDRPAGDDGEPEVATGGSDARRTRVGGVLGTAAYMPPEQARGEGVDARADVYALGAILYEVLSGRPPYVGRDVAHVLQQVVEGPPPRPGPRAEHPDLPPLPVDLVALCARCLARDPADRPADGGVVAAELRSWLDGATQRARAREVVARADAVVADAEALRQQASRARISGVTRLAAIPLWAPEDVKAPAWEEIDRAAAVELEASQLELTREALLRGALTHAPDLADAHAGLVDLELSRHAAAEAAREPGQAARAERRVREHLESLPASHPVRGRAVTYLRGDGALTLHTERPGAEVRLSRVELRNRRMVEVPVRSLGTTPLRAVTLPMGSWVCLIRQEGRADLRYPVHLERGEHWDGAPPASTTPRPVWQPRDGELGVDDCPVPAGWFWSGGDPDAVDGLARRRLWCDDLVVRRFPVTNREYLAFLNALVDAGRAPDALRLQPAMPTVGRDAEPMYGRGDDGRFELRADAEGDRWDPDWPVMLVDWHGATAYAEWLAARTGLPWRLLGELEWEKAARGVDGRFFPFGDVCDPSWCCLGPSHPGRALPQLVDSFPVDASPYGVRGVAGNVQQWCADAFHRDGPPTVGARVGPPAAPDPRDLYLNQRGGYWGGPTRIARSAGRSRSERARRSVNLGFRVAYRPGPVAAALDPRPGVA